MCFHKRCSWFTGFYLNQEQGPGPGAISSYDVKTLLLIKKYRNVIVKLCEMIEMWGFPIQ